MGGVASLEQANKNGIMIREMPSDERPREKMIRYGSDALSNAELLALLIRTGTKSSSAIMLANKVLALDNTGLAFLADCVPEELAKVEGIGVAKACQIVAAAELGKRMSALPREKRVNITTPWDVSEVLMADMRHLKKEYFKAIILNSRHEILMIDNISVGTVNSSVAFPREVFSKALKKGGVAIILAHNHPSGNPEPSEEDIAVTERLSKAGELLGIAIIDHIIIGDGIFVSFKEKGMVI